jgi:hypothetical protein
MLSLELTPVDGSSFHGKIMWSAPTDNTGPGYVLWYTTSPSGWDTATDVTVTKLSGDLLEETVAGIAMGAVLRAKVGMAYSDDSGASGDSSYSTTSSNWAPEEFTAIQNLQAAAAPDRPGVPAITFIGLSHEKTDQVDMLMRFNLSSFNGGSPDVGIIDYSPSPYFAGASLGGATVKLTNELMQLGVVSKFPIDTLAGIVITLETTRDNGLVGNTERLSSSTSVALQLRVRAPQPAHTLASRFDAIERGASVFSAVVEWTSGIEEDGNAPVRSHTIYARSVATASLTCAFATTVDGTRSCNNSALAISAYPRVLPTQSALARGVVSSLPMSKAACFVVTAENAVGTGEVSAHEVCIDVAALLRNRCEAGTMLSNPAIFVCEKCELGRFNAAQGANCVACANGTFTAATGLSACTECAVGLYLPSSASVSCENCEIGRFAAMPKAVTCDACVGGAFTAATGLSACAECAVGLYLPSSASVSCENCEIGRFAAMPGAVTCDDCASGAFTAVTGLSACAECAVGLYLPSATSVRCEKCEIGRFSAMPGAVTCDDCASGAFTAVTGLSACAECAVGLYLSSATSVSCEKCEIGRFAAMPGTVTCAECDVPGTYTQDSGATVCSVCSDDFHAVRKKGNTSAAVCAKCPSAKALDCTNGVLEWQPKAWYDPSIPTHAIDENTEVHQCFNDVCCMNPDGDKSRVECVKELGYYGPLCGACDRKRDFIRSGFGCQKCWQKVYSYLGSAVMIVAFVVVVMCFAVVTDFDRPSGDYSGVVLKIFFSHLQVRTFCVCR